MSKYILTVKLPEITVSIDLQYNEMERLTGFWVRTDIPEKTLDWLINRLPIYRSKLSVFDTIKQAKIQEVAEDLTFPTFWNRYGVKISSKKKTQKLWEDLTDKDKELALLHLSEYEMHLRTNSGVTKQYADTYLRRRNWED